MGAMGSGYFPFAITYTNTDVLHHALVLMIENMTM
jgi:hypothetical protein